MSDPSQQNPGDGSTVQKPTACAVSIEVDGRQAYLFESDKLREMLGASRIIDATRTKAEEVFKEADRLHVFNPVSGEIRAWACIDKRDALLHATWQMRGWLDCKGVSHSVAYLECSEQHFTKEPENATGSERNTVLDLEPEQPSLAWVHRELSRRIRRVKDAKGGEDARPTCALFTPCRIHGSDPANLWTPGEDEDKEKRRELVGYRARAKYEVWGAEKRAFYDEHLTGLLIERISTDLLTRCVELEKRACNGGENQQQIKERCNLLFSAAERLEEIEERLIQAWDDRGRTVRRPIVFSDMSDRKRSIEASDSYIAFLCADGDGMGGLLSKVDWNSTDWGRDFVKPWERNRRFSLQYDRCVKSSFHAAVHDQILHPDGVETSDEEEERQIEKLVSKLDAGKPIYLPLLPQVLGGDDLWMVVERRPALRFARVFAKKYEELAKGASFFEEKNVLKKALSVSGDSKEDAITISMGVAFAKAGYPAHAMADAAEELMVSAKGLRKQKLPGRKREGKLEGCVDWHWIESSLSETVKQARERGAALRDGSSAMILPSRPWSSEQTGEFLDAARVLARVPRRKREQLETICRLGKGLGELAMQGWWKGLDKGGRDAIQDVNKVLPKEWKLWSTTSGFPRAPRKSSAARQRPLGCGRSPRYEDTPADPPDQWWRQLWPSTTNEEGPQEEEEGNVAPQGAGTDDSEIKTWYATCLLDLLSLQHVLGLEGASPTGSSSSTGPKGSSSEEVSP